MIVRLWTCLSLIWVALYLWAASAYNGGIGSADVRVIVAPFVLGSVLRWMIRYVVYGAIVFRRRTSLER